VNATETTLRVLIVDDHALVREGIASLLAACDDIEVVGSAERAVDALEQVGELGVDVVLMDLAMPDVDGVTATARLRQQHPDVQVVVLTGYGNEVSVRAAVVAGAKACLLKTVGVDELADAVRGVTQGRSTFSSEFLPHLLQDAEEVVPGARLTARERDVLPLLAAGLTNKGIARELGLTEGTVRIYVSAILAKLGVTNRTEASVVAIREHLVEPRPSRSGPPDRPR
jgi:two-component system, NarL family, response regulator LiaR